MNATKKYTFTYSAFFFISSSLISIFKVEKERRRRETETYFPSHIRDPGVLLS